MKIFRLLKISSITVPGSVLVGKLQLKFWKKVLHLVDNLPWLADRRDGGRENVRFSVLSGSVRNFKVFSPSVSFADSSLVRGSLGATERCAKLTFERSRGMKHKYALYPIIMSICALLCFIAVLILFSGAVQPPWGRMMLLILPALLLGLLALCAAKGKLGVIALFAPRLSLPLTREVARR